MTLKIIDLRCEGQVNPIGIGHAQPRLSWTLESDQQGARQTAYQIQVSDDTGVIWDTGKVESDAQRMIAEAPLKAGERYRWRARVWDEHGAPSAWSDEAAWEMTMLTANEWITADAGIDPKAFNPCPYLRTTFIVAGVPVLRARVYVTAHGVYELSLNGRVVSEDVLAPGCTSYHERLQFQTYAVEDLLTPGENVIGAILGDGWYRGKQGVTSNRNVYGEKLALLLQLRIIYTDGSQQWITTDDNWKTTTGPILKSDLKDGEIYDARLEIPGWDKPGFDDSGWRGVEVFREARDNLIAAEGPPTRRHETFTPIVLHTPNGQTVLDFGQNIAGRVRMRVRGSAGTTIRLRHGEALDKDGNYTMANLTSDAPIAKMVGFDPLLQEVSYTLRGGDDDEIYEPRFTFQGFRYALVEVNPSPPVPHGEAGTSIPTPDPSPPHGEGSKVQEQRAVAYEIRAEDFTAVALYSDMTETGQFECSDPLINQLHANVMWSLKGNFLEIPTDCPQRERAGWTGDAQVFARTSALLMDVSGFFERWLKDLATEQRPDGLVPNLVPDLTRHVPGGIIAATNGSAGWGDAAVIIPYAMYQHYGDVSILQAQYASAKKWVDYAAGRAEQGRHWTKRFSQPASHERYIWDTNYHWGEWLEPGTQIFLTLARNFTLRQPSVATAFLAYSARLLSEIAEILGKDDDAQQYRTLHENVKAAWVKEFVISDTHPHPQPLPTEWRGEQRANESITGDIRLRPDRQATYVRALAFDLLPEAMRAAAARRLVDLIREKNGHLDTGFLATPFILDVLARFGYLDVAYAVLKQTTPPSWLYEITKGATTTWEFWEVIRPDGTVTLGSMNHYSPGAVASWLYQTIAGINGVEPGYKRSRIQPQPGGGLTWARAKVETPYGALESAWEIADGKLRLNVTIPPNTRAEIWLPGAAAGQEVGAGRYTFEGQVQPH